MDIRDLAGGKNICLIGRSTAVPTTLIDLSEFNQAQSFCDTFAAAAKLDIASSSASDTLAGTGARSLRIVGLDAGYKPLVEDINLNGQTMIMTVNAFLRVFGARALTAGSGRVNAGDIYIVKSGSGGTWTAGVPATVTSGQIKMLAGYGQAYSGMLTVPAAKTYRATGIVVSGRAQLGTIFLAVQEAGDGVLRHEFPIEVAPPMNPVQIDLTNFRGFIFPEKTDIRLRALAVTAGGIFSAKLLLDQVS
jgi:hypothetical protein